MAHVVISLVHADEQQTVAIVSSRKSEIFCESDKCLSNLLI